MAPSARALLVLLPFGACGVNKTSALSEPTMLAEASSFPVEEGDAGLDASGASLETDGSEDGDSDAAPADASSEVDGSTIELTLCSRLDDPQRPAHTSTLSMDVEQTYIRLVYLDCSVARMVTDDEDTLSVFQNALVSWNLTFWGCRAEGTSQLGILRAGFDDATPGEIARLVEHYVAACNQVLLLSPPEELEMRQALAVLGASLVPDADALTLSTCAVEAGSDDGGDDGSFDAE